MKIYTILLATLVAAVTATDFTCAKTEVAVCCSKQTDDSSKCAAAELEDNDDDSVTLPTYYCSSRRFARCCDSGAAATNEYKTIIIGPQTGVLSYAFTLTAKAPATTAPAASSFSGLTSPVTVARKCKEIASDESSKRRRNKL